MWLSLILKIRDLVPKAAFIASGTRQCFIGMFYREVLVSITRFIILLLTTFSTMMLNKLNQMKHKPYDQIPYNRSFRKRHQN